MPKIKSSNRLHKQMQHTTNTILIKPTWKLTFGLSKFSNRLHKHIQYHKRHYTMLWWYRTGLLVNTEQVQQQRLQFMSQAIIITHVHAQQRVADTITDVDNIDVNSQSVSSAKCCSEMDKCQQLHKRWLMMPRVDSNVRCFTENCPSNALHDEQS